jgi:translation initiation factor IF-1
LGNGELPLNAMSRMKFDSNREMLAPASGEMRKNCIRVKVGDRLDVELTAYDMSAGRITFRCT